MQLYVKIRIFNYSLIPLLAQFCIFLDPAFSTFWNHFLIFFVLALFYFLTFGALLSDAQFRLLFNFSGFFSQTHIYIILHTAYVDLCLMQS